LIQNSFEILPDQVNSLWLLSRERIKEIIFTAPIIIFG
jgi:hypothetical protein